MAGTARRRGRCGSPSRIGKEGGGHRPDRTSGWPVRAAAAARATQSPSTIRSATARPAASKASRTSAFAVDEDAGREQRAASRAARRGARGERYEDAGDEVGEDDVERRLPTRQAPVPGIDPPTEAVPPRVGQRGLDRDRVGVEPERAVRPELERGDGEDARPTADVEHARAPQTAVGRPAARAPPGTAGSSDGARSRRPCPGSSARTTSSGRARWRRQVGPDDQPPADAQDREMRLPGLGPVGFVDDAGPQLADRAQPERLQVAEAASTSCAAASASAPVAHRARSRGRSPAGPGRPARRGPRRRDRTLARRSSRRSRPGPGSR